MLRLHRDAKIELLSRVPLFEHCSKRELAAIAGLADQVDLPEKRVVMREGRLGHEFFVLIEGKVKVSRDGKHLETLEAGDFFGEIALISNVPRTATVETVSPAQALVVSNRAFWALLDGSTSIQRKILQAAGDRLAKHSKA
jgi:CRP-like cAMP-binding protein